MAGKRKTNSKPGRSGRIALCSFLALLAAFILLAGVSALNAGIVRVRRAEVELADLPESFDGTSILYASDIDLCGTNTAQKCGALFRRLQSLHPDILLLGGDYTSVPLLEYLNRAENSPSDDVTGVARRSDFFQYIASFEAPVGKFAIAAPEDPDWENLSLLMTQSGVHPLFNDRTALHSGGSTLWLAGICSESAGLNGAGSAFHRGDCVVAAAYSPQVLPLLLTSEAIDGGQWADLMLCGHTHGGQVRLFGKSALALTPQEQDIPAGWTVSGSLPILVTQGLGCEGLNLRLGSQPEVWLITLRRARSPR